MTTTNPNTKGETMKFLTFQTQINEIKVYWDGRDPDNVGWSYWAAEDGDMVTSGAIRVEDADELTDAVDQVCIELDLDITSDDFELNHNLDGGVGYYHDMEFDD
jgi:hypothetical protein